MQVASETHYSLKEMETATHSTLNFLVYIQSETHYSLKEMETIVRLMSRSDKSPCRKPTTL